MDEYAPLIGRTIVAVRQMTDEELNHYGWEGGSVPVLVLDDGTQVVPSRDDEGNGGGTLFFDNPTI